MLKDNENVLKVAQKSDSNAVLLLLSKLRLQRECWKRTALQDPDRRKGKSFVHQKRRLKRCCEFRVLRPRLHCWPSSMTLARRYVRPPGHLQHLLHLNRQGLRLLKLSKGVGGLAALQRASLKPSSPEEAVES
jgi:hypothetical protein